MVDLMPGISDGMTSLLLMALRMSCVCSSGVRASLCVCVFDGGCGDMGDGRGGRVASGGVVVVVEGIERGCAV